MKKKLLSEISKKLFRPWEILLHNYVKEYNIVKAIMERNVSNFMQAFERIRILYDLDHMIKCKQYIIDLDKLINEKTPLREEKINELINLHLVFISILFVLLGILMTVLFTGGKI